MSRLVPKRREPFGKAGLTVAICALVLAMVGGAYAAGGLTKSQEKQVTKIAKKYAGKPGATGPAGTAGTNGTNGKDGAAGAKGEQGIQGSPGTPGQNGTTGFTETLPSGETETGMWAVTAGQVEGNNALATISFNIPLAEEPVLKILKEGEGETAECPGNAEEPQAEKGFVCLYTIAESEEFPSVASPQLPTKTGVLVGYNNLAKGKFRLGSWAVTAE